MMGRPRSAGTEFRLASASAPYARCLRAGPRCLWQGSAAGWRNLVVVHRICVHLHRTGIDVLRTIVRRTVIVRMLTGTDRFEAANGIFTAQAAYQTATPIVLVMTSAHFG